MSTIAWIVLIVIALAALAVFFFGDECVEETPAEDQPVPVAAPVAPVAKKTVKKAATKKVAKKGKK